MILKHYRKLTKVLLPLVLLIIGLYLVPLKIFDTDFSKIPGDMGDARFNNYILEHGYKYLSGKVNKYWDAPFMYPHTNVIAFSDNLLGTLPVYSFYRFMGADRESSFQFWILTLFALNFICCFLTLNKWSNNIILSSSGAYIYAFGIFIIGHFNHLQVFPRFIVPLVFYWCWMYLSEKNIKYLCFTLMGIVFQFYCGIYIGFFLVYCLMFFTTSYIIIYKDWSLFLQFKKIKIVSNTLIIILIAGLLLSPLMIPYIKVSNTLGLRKFDDVIATIPKIRSYFFTHIAASTWRNILSEHSKFAFPDWWSHFLFVGALPWMGILSLPAILFSKKIDSKNKKFISLIFLGLLLNILFCINIKGHSLYRFIFEIQGFASMRAIDRIINTQVMYFILIFVFVFKELCTNYRWMKWIILSFPILVIIDNRIDHWELKQFDKFESQQKVKEIREKIVKQYDKHYAAIAYIPLNKPNDYFEAVETHISVMLAAQEVSIPCVNAYTGFNPGNYLSFFDNMDKKTLNDWCEYNKKDSTSIQNINEDDIKTR